ncbi:MAG: MFS transporter [Bacillus subtilis]|nr:MFS transporter [Bacillus subtilis]
MTPAFVRNLEIKDYMFGVYFSAMSFGLMLGGPFWGVLGDQGNRKRYIVIGLLLYSLGQFGFGYTHDATLMVVSRFISGFGVVTPFTLFTSRIIEESENRHRTRNLAYIGAATTLGSSLGYFLGGWMATNPWMSSLLGTSDLSVIFLIQSIANLFYVLLIVIVYREVFVKPAISKRNALFSGFKQVAKLDASLFVFLISLTFMTIGSVNLGRYIDVYFDELGYNSQQLGTFVMATGFVSLFVTLFVIPIVAKFSKQLALISIVQVASSIIVFYVFRAERFLLVVYTVYMMYIVFRTIYPPLEQNYISRHAVAGQYGTIMGVRQSFASIGMVIGPLLGGFLYEIRPLLVFDVSAIMFLLGTALLGVVHLMRRKHSPART